MDKKSLLIFLVIITVAATVAFNFEEFTGQSSLTVLEESLAAQPKGEGSVTVDPKVIEAGSIIHITIKPGDKCIDNEIAIYKTDRKLPVTRFKKSAQSKGSSTGTSKYCKEATIEYKTWNSWEEGDYYVEVRELPMKVTGKIKERTAYYTDNFKIKATESYPKVIISSLGGLVSNPQIISGQRYIFKD